MVGSHRQTGVIETSYAAGFVDFPGQIGAGGLVGVAHHQASVTDSYWDTDTSLMQVSAGGVGRNTNDLQRANFYPASWDFGAQGVWEIIGNEYPNLRLNPR